MATKNAPETNTQVDTTTGEFIGAPAPAMPPLKLKKRVTVPLLKQRVGVPIAIVFLAPIYQGEKIDHPSVKIAEAAFMARVLNVQDGVVYNTIMNTVTRSEIEKAYPDNGYVGKGFAITLHNLEGKNYKVPEIAEFETADYAEAIDKAMKEG